MPIPPNISRDEQLLGALALKFRGTRDDADRRAIARDYAQAVERLINSGYWDEVPSIEDQLPDDWMPNAFFQYWSLPQGRP